MVRKEFFKERTEAEIRDLHTQNAPNQRDLVKRISGLNPSTDGIIIYSRLTPGRFFHGGVNSAKAGKRNIVRGDYIQLDSSQTYAQALDDPRIPLDFRREAMQRYFADFRREEDINVVGFSYRPVSTLDQMQRQIPFYIGPEGERIFAYGEISEELSGIVGKNAGVTVKPYADAKKVAREGGKISVKVPSRQSGGRKYEMKFPNMPLIATTDRLHNPRAIIWNLNSDYSVWPKDAFWRFGYTKENDLQASDRKIWIPQDVAAYIAVIKDQNKKGNWVPMVVNPFALGSRKQAEFYLKLRNNVLFAEPNEENKLVFRKPHLDEISMLLARQAFVEGHDATMFWDFERDGRFRDYNWKLGGN